MLELKGVPTFRRLLPFTAYSEGWALYTKQLAWEAGFQNNPLDNLGRMQAELFRAVRLVVDTGLHHQRWTREQAIDYMRDNTGMGEKEVTGLQGRDAEDPGAAGEGPLGTGRALRHSRVPRCGAGAGGDAADLAGAAGGGVGGGEGVMTELPMDRV